MFKKNSIFYNNKKVEELTVSNIKLDINGIGNQIFINKFCGDGVLHIRVDGNNNIFKLGENNIIRSNLYIDFCNTEDGKPERCSILIGNGNIFNGNVFITSSSVPGTVVSIGDKNMWANNVHIRAAGYHLLYDIRTMEKINEEVGVFIGNSNWICMEVLILNKAKIGNNCTIGIRSLVNRSFLGNDNSLIAGVPASVKRKYVMWNKSFKDFSETEQFIYKSKDVIPIFLIAADDIVAPMTVTMASILSNTNSFIEFYILERSTLQISSENRERVLKLKEKFDNFSIEYIPINPDDYSDLSPTTSTYIPKDTYFRYVIPEVKPEIKKAIYLDIDIIVKTDIKNLFDEPLNDCCLGAVNHPKYCWNYPYYKKVVDNLKLKGRDIYINGGVLVFDCERCRKNKITKKLFDTTRKLKNKLIWADQDVFNLVFQDTLQLLPEKYNSLKSVYENEKITDKAIINDIAIIHFNGPEKPWNSGTLFQEEFWKYAKLTDFQSDLNVNIIKKHISFLLGRIHEYDTTGCIGNLNRHISFILGRIKNYDFYFQNIFSLEDSTCYYFKLFGIPLLRIKNSFNNRKYYLLSKFQIMRIKRENDKNKYLLLGFIPVFSVVKKKLINTDKLYDKNKLKFTKKEKIKIYFLYHSDVFWPSWKSVWNSINQDERIKTKMIYCPVKKQHSGYEGQFVNSEQFLKEQNIEYINVNDWNIEKDKPHILIIQTPYDVYHRIPCFYSEEFKKKGIRIIYISYGLEFTETSLSIENHFKLPIYKNAWKIYSFAKFLKNDYLKYGNIGKNIVESIGHPKFDNLFCTNSSKGISDIKKKANGKKIIVWHPHFPCNYSNVDGKEVCSTFSWQEDIKLLHYIKKRKDVFCIFMPHHLFFGVFENLFGISKTEIKEFQDIIKNSKNICLWNGDYVPVLKIADLFLGERSAVTIEMLITNKPVIYLEQNPEIYNNFGKDVINSYYYAKTAKEVILYINTILSGQDIKKKLRQAVFDKYIAEFFDGKCGYRIKENIIYSLKNE